METAIFMRLSGVIIAAFISRRERELGFFLD
jgi:hypothetical protein